MTLRPMTAADAAAVAALETAIFPDPWDTESVCSSVGSPAAFCFVAEEGGEVVGYLLGSFIAPEGEIFRIATDPGKRRQGIARALLGFALGKTPDLTDLYLEVRESNAGARAFYLAFGFAETGKRKNYYSDPREDAVLMAYRRERGSENE